MDELPGEAGFANPWLPHDGNHLPVPARRSLQGSAELIQLVVAPDEAAEAPRDGRVEPRSHGAGPDEVIDLHRL